MSTGTELSTLLTTYLHNDSSLSAADKLIYLNLAQKRIIRDAPTVLRKKQATLTLSIAGGREYSLAADFYQMQAMWVPSVGIKLFPSMPGEWIETVERLPSIPSGSPEAYIILGYDESIGTPAWRIKFDRIPDGDYTVYYWYNYFPAEITGSATPLLSTIGFDELLLWGATMIALQPKDPEGYASAHENYIENLEVFRNFRPAAPDYSPSFSDQFESTRTRVQVISGYDLTTALADTSNADSGDFLIGYKASGTGAVARTVHSRFTDFSVSVKDYGALGDGITDDTVAIQAAIDAANTSYLITGSPSIVQFPCMSFLIGGHIVCGSGVHLRGPATLRVAVQDGWTVTFLNASDVSCEGITFQNDSAPSENNYLLGSVRWVDDATSTTTHNSVRIKNNIIHGGTWGISIVYDHGTGGLTKLDVSGNHIDSPAPYQNFDGIHIEGNIWDFVVTNNLIMNRDDNAIGLNSTFSGGESWELHDGVVSNNVGINNIIGINASGARDLIITGNYMVNSVTATALNTMSNTASYGFVMLPMAYPLGYGHDMQIVNNVFTSGAGLWPTGSANGSAGFDAAVDYWNYDGIANIHFRNNKFGNSGLYLRANTGTVFGNTFVDDAQILFSWADEAVDIPATNWIIGINYWEGDGNITAEWTIDTGAVNVIANQSSVGTVSYVNQPYGWADESPTFKKVSLANNFILRNDTNADPVIDFASGVYLYYANSVNTFYLINSGKVMQFDNAGLLTAPTLVGQLSIPSGGSESISTGAGAVKMTTASAANNSVWIPITYEGTTYYVPGWTTHAP